MPSLSLAQTLWPNVLLHAPVAAFIFCFGACVGSFINVVIHRLPAGMSVTIPPSRCPTCGARLKFFSENLPILGWFLVRGRCKHCGVRVSPEYMVIELLMALLFLGLYLLLYTIPPSTPWWGRVGGEWWYYNGIFRTWPTFTAWTFLLAALVAMTVIDARTFTIPIQIPLFITITAFIAYPLQALLPLAMRTAPGKANWPIQTFGWHGAAVVFGGTLGILIALLLLKAGKLRYSFADYHQHVPEGQAIGDYPHARREMAHEIVFLSPCIAGLLIGWFVGRLLPPPAAISPPIVVQALAASLAGYLMGGGLIWGIRILGTLGFGREAMGLGDVHLLAAVGAVLGWFDPIIIFFLAPFSGLAWVVVSMGLASMFKRARRELPYGPHLAAAAVLLILLRPGIQQAWMLIFPGVPWPRPGLA